MIETTYVRLEKAAEMLGTDRETLLLAAIEGRIKLYGLFGQAVWAIGPDYTAEDFYMEHDLFLESGLQDALHRQPVYVTYVDVDRLEAVEVLRNGVFRPSSFESPSYFPEKDQNIIWDIDSPDDEVPEVSIQDVLIKRVDVENIKANARLPEQDTIPTPPKRKGADTKVHNNQLRLIGCLVELIRSGTDEHGKAISTYTQEQIIGYLTDQFPDIPGLGKSHLENTFADAKRALLGARIPK